jgi:hypothetical protein
VIFIWASGHIYFWFELCHRPIICLFLRKLYNSFFGLKAWRLFVHSNSAFFSAERRGTENAAQPFLSLVTLAVEWTAPIIFCGRTREITESWLSNEESGTKSSGAICVFAVRCTGGRRCQQFWRFILLLLGVKC